MADDNTDESRMDENPGDRKLDKVEECLLEKMSEMAEDLKVATKLEALEMPQTESLGMWEVYQTIVENIKTANKEGKEFSDERPDECLELREEYKALIQEGAHKQRLETGTRVLDFLKQLSEHKHFDIGPNKDSSPISGNLYARFLSYDIKATMEYASLVKQTVLQFYEHYAPEMSAVIQEYLRRLLSQKGICYKVSRTTFKDKPLHISSIWGCTNNTTKEERMWVNVVNSCLSELDEKARKYFKVALLKACVQVYEETDGVCFECCIETEEGKVRCPGKTCKTRFLDAFIYRAHYEDGVEYGKKTTSGSSKNNARSPRHSPT